MKGHVKLKPRILVIIPTLGQRIKYLQQTLDSVAGQAPIAYDIVFVCPLNNADLKSLAQKYGARMVADPGGISAAVNKGIAQAKPYHEFISWIGDDDLLKPGSFATALDALDNNPQGVLAFGYCDYIDGNGRHLFTSKVGSLAPWLMTWGPNLVPLPGILFRLSALRKAGEFDTKNKYSMDLDMLLRIRKYGQLLNTRTSLAAFRWHATSATVANKNASLAEAEAVKRRYLPRYMQVMSVLWNRPVRLASKLAAYRVSKLAAH